MIILGVTLLSFALLSFLTVCVSNQVYKHRSRTKKAKKGPLNFERIRQVIADQDSTTQELQEAVKVLVSKYPKIKSGESKADSKEEYNKYATVIQNLCLHQRADKDMVLLLDKTLRKQNPAYQKELDLELKRALSMRKF